MCVCDAENPFGPAVSWWCEFSCCLRRFPHSDLLHRRVFSARRCETQPVCWRAAGTALSSDRSWSVLDWSRAARRHSSESLRGRRQEANSSFHWVELSDWSAPHSQILWVILVPLQLWRSAVYSWALLLVIRPQIFPQTGCQWGQQHHSVSSCAQKAS